MTRPRLKSHARLLRRGPGAVQLGLAPDLGVVLDGLTEPEIALLARLADGATLPSLYAEASGAGVLPARVDALLQALRHQDLLVDEPTDRATLARLGAPLRHELAPDADALAVAYPGGGDGYAHVAARQHHHVVVGGEGGLAAALAGLLRSGGVGRVDVGVAALDALDLGLRHGRERVDPPDLVVLLGAGAIDPGAGAPWLRRGIPHLPVVAQGTRVHVGPLVRRGSGPCLRCLDLQRSERDAAWPALLAQLAPHRAVGTPPPVSTATPLTAVAAGLAAMVVHTHLDARGVPVGVSLEASMPWPQVSHRRWAPHPRCECADYRRADAALDVDRSQ